MLPHISKASKKGKNVKRSLSDRHFINFKVGDRLGIVYLSVLMYFAKCFLYDSQFFVQFFYFCAIVVHRYWPGEIAVKLVKGALIVFCIRGIFLMDLHSKKMSSFNTKFFDYSLNES